MTDLAVVSSTDEDFGAGGTRGLTRGISRGISGLGSGEKSRVMVPPKHIMDALNNQNSLKQPPRKTRDIGGGGGKKSLWTVSGCQDNQTSADACIGGIKQGALTWSLHSALEHCNYDVTYEELLHMCRKKLKGKYTQIPSMSTTVAENFKCKFLGQGLKSHS